jgi:sec-independent protein translocase protein TatA
MLGFDNPTHLIFLLAVLLLVFGAKRLPEVGRSLGSGMRGFKDSLSGEQTEANVLPQYVPVASSEAPPLGPGAHERGRATR